MQRLDDIGMLFHVEAIPGLTKRKTEALEWSAEEKSMKDIAILMRISAETVKAHLDSARYKLHALNRIHAVIIR